jgi:hypothetical protein
MLVIASSDKHEFTEGMACRIKEALQFCMGQQLDWSIMTLSKGGQEQTFLRGIISNEKTGRVYPPITDYQNPDNTGDAIRLMDCYLSKTIDCQDTSVHPLFHPLYAVILASQSTTVTEALTLVTSIESLLGISAIDVEQESETINGLKTFKNHIDSEQYPANFKKRLNGLLGMIGSPSSVDKLNYLVKEGAARQDLVDVWKKMRPKLAHGNYAIDDFQKFIDMVHAVHVLLHHLLFHSIGYKGKYTDYSKDGWPILEYPNK